MYPRLVMYLALQCKHTTIENEYLYGTHTAALQTPQSLYKKKKKFIATYICIVNRHFLHLLVAEIQCVYNPTTTSLLSPFYFTCNKNLHAFPHLVVSMLSLVCLFVWCSCCVSAAARWLWCKERGIWKCAGKLALHLGAAELGMTISSSRFIRILVCLNMMLYVL